MLRLRPGQTFSQALFHAGLIRLEEFYRNAGYRHFRVVQKEVRQTPEGVDIELWLYEGPRAVIARLTYAGVQQLDSLLVARLFHRYRTPRPYDVDDLHRLESDLLNLYAEQGFPYASVRIRQQELRPDTFEVQFQVEEGPRVVIQRVELRGLHQVRRQIVLRELRFHPPCVYQASKVLESIRNIYLTGLFSSVLRRLEPVNAEGDTVVLVLELHEVKPRYLEIGGGWRQPLFAEFQVSLGHRNLFGNNQRLEMRTEGLLDFSQETWQERWQRRRVEISYSEPYFLGSPLKATAHPFYERDLQVKKEEYGVDLQLLWIASPYLSFTGAVEWKRTPLQPSRSGPLINSLIFIGLWDSRDNLFDPRRGAFASLKLQNAGGPVLDGDNTFYRAILDFSYYAPHRRHWVVAGRFRSGYQRPYGTSRTIPSSERFFMGGEGSLRGYADRSVGPVDPDNPEVHSGNLLLNLNLELRYRNGRWGGALFLDGGNLWFSVPEMRQQFRILWTAGLGIRYFTPIGPVRLDWGYRLQDRTPGYKGRLYLALGHMF